MLKKQDDLFLDNSGKYKAGVKEEDYRQILEDAKKQAELDQQAQIEEARKAKKQNKINVIKNHTVPYSQVSIDFKIIFVLSIIAFVTNIVLSIVYKDFLWSNIFNLIAAPIIFWISRHIYTKPLNDMTIKINSILKQNICQVTSDIMKYKTSNLFDDNIMKIADIISIVAAICFVLFTSYNILYAIAAVACLFMVFLLISEGHLEEIGSHLRMINKSLLIGIIIKAIYHVIVGKFVLIDYMNVALMFLFTFLKIWFVDNEPLE